ncbi:MAG: protein-L-isoaspartate O-methyltransferase [Arenicellales bacterium]|jgi:protein-L-isoaspartate(D-aspartate) O-methyltransferase|nr:protein-L-isoaspartate O-methyltransferase [Arenicellales bacterium]
MDIERARFNMIEQQIRTWEVLDSWVLSTLQDFHREDFVPAGYTDLAFADIQIPIGHGQTMMEPRLEARLLQTLALTGGESVLEIGTGTGCMTALLARCAKTVTSVDIHGDFLKGAAQRLRQTGINTVTLEEGDAADDWKPGSTWDAILLTGSVPEIPPAFERAVAKNGRLVAVVGQNPIMEAIIIFRDANGALSRRSLFDTHVAPLINTPSKRAFEF